MFPACPQSVRRGSHDWPHRVTGGAARAARTLAVALLVAVAGCARSDAPPGDRPTATRPALDTLVDDFGAVVPVDARATSRIVSLNPAATEAIYAMGEAARLVGRSRWDEFPDAAKALPALGDGIRPNVEAVLAVRPTLVVLYATGDNRAAAEAFTRAGVRTIALRVDRIEQFAHLMDVLGRALDATTQAATVRDSVLGTLDRVRALVRRRVPDSARPRVAWPVWVSPPLVIGAGSYMDQLLDIAGAVNVFHDLPEPSPSVSIEELVRRAPARLVNSAEMREKLRASPQWRGVPAVSADAFVLDDPALIGRPSVTLGMAAVHLARQMHPALADSLR